MHVKLPELRVFAHSSAIGCTTAIVRNQVAFGLKTQILYIFMNPHRTAFVQNKTGLESSHAHRERLRIQGARARSRDANGPDKLKSLSGPFATPQYPLLDAQTKHLLIKIARHDIVLFNLIHSLYGHK